MRYLKLYEGWLSKKINNYKIHEICKKHGIKNYTINNDGSIDVNNKVNLQCRLSTKLPLKFNRVDGNFYYNNNRSTSLEGSPKEVNGSFFCFYNKLTSFQYAPKIIRDVFNCEHNNIKTFEYFPSYIGDEFYCEENPIFEVWRLFKDTNKIELLNDFDIFRDEDTETPSIIMDRLNDFLTMIGKKEVEKVDQYKNI